MVNDRRPPSVTVLALVYIAMGAVGFVYHLPDLLSAPLRFDGLGVELIRLLAILAGSFLLKARNWARWLAVLWIAAHVVISAFHSPLQCALHAAFAVVICYILYRPAAARYFS